MKPNGAPGSPTAPADMSGAVRTTDLRAVRDLVRLHGYAVVTGHNCRTAPAASQLAAEIWQDDLLAAPEACEVRDGAVGDDGRRNANPGGRVIGPHSDGFACEITSNRVKHFCTVLDSTAPLSLTRNLIFRFRR